MKRTLSLLLSAALAVSLLAGCGPKPVSNGSGSSTPDSASSSQPDESGSAGPSAPQADTPTIRFMALSGPTGVGASWLMDSYSTEHAFDGMPFVLDSTIVTDNQEVTNALTNKSVDIAAIATNAAATLYAKSGGSIQVLTELSQEEAKQWLEGQPPGGDSAPSFAQILKGSFPSKK